MTKEQVIKKCREAIEVNKSVRETTNNALSHAIGLLEKNDDEYERGANDAWELARKIGRHPVDGGYDCDELYLRFDSYTTSDVFNEYTFQEALAKVKEYEKKKEEESAKPKLGDVVEVICNRDGFVEKGIFLSECFDTITYIIADGGVVKASSNHFKFIKTGEYVDIHGMLDKIK